MLIGAECAFCGSSCDYVGSQKEKIAEILEFWTTTWSQPVEESSHMSRNEMFEHIVELLGGRAAEEIVFQDITTGLGSIPGGGTKTSTNCTAWPN